MARKSNKTSHVLNLLAGHDNKEKNNTETENTETVTAKTADKSGASPQSVSVIDKTEEDELAHLIQEQLEKELECEQTDKQTSTVEEIVSEPIKETVTNTEPETSEIAEKAASDIQPETTDVVEEAVEETVLDPQPETTAVAEETVEEADADLPLEKAEAIQDLVGEVAKEQDPEPDFLLLNVMEHIVKDKIIYFMRQFDVCTCDRCIADTIALTLNGLAPKYMVTTPTAADPLLSFYTNKFISDITVEATKACMVIKENPRH